jgi:formylglycine-generating enzyme required for sulfatase activity
MTFGRPEELMNQTVALLVRLVIAAVVGTVCVASPASAERRVALVIGNSAYQHTSPLDNPRNDADLMAETLRVLGFALVGNGAQVDLDKAAFDDILQKFGNQMVGADVALFYYAGHGVQVRGSNYLVPVNANPTREADVLLQAIDTSLVLAAMEGSGTKLNLVLLDACRNNPFAGRGLRGAEGGLAQMRAPEGTLISYATQPGNVAYDGDKGHSPYTDALARTIRRAGLDLFQTFNEVGLSVMQTTGNSQQPWVSASPIKGTFHFVISGELTVTPPTAGRMSDAAEAWAATQNSTSIGVLEAFADRFGNTIYGRMARARIEELKRLTIAPIPGPPSSRVQTAEVAPPVRPNFPCTSHSSTGVSLSSRAAKPLSADEECALKPKDVFRECDKCPDMVMVPAGTFTMGSPANELDGSDRERPQHVVTIGQPLAVGKFAVTVDQFAAFIMETHGQAGSSCRTLEGGKMEERAGRSWRDPGFPQTGVHPAVCINFADAEAYVDWLSMRTGKRYRLLTEAEWEYAARAGTTTRFFFGNDEKSLCRYGNGTDVTAKARVPGLGPSASCNDGYAYTAPVGSFLANAFGLYDMHGNVRQWVEDCFHASYAGAPADGSAWKSTDCAARVQRGGAWGYRPANLRSAYRDGIEPTLRRSFTGFRVARSL